jgi:hypothetical protein
MAAFTKNDSRINRRGRPRKGKSLTEALQKALKQKRKDGRKNYDALADTLVKLAIEDKNIAAIKCIMDRVDGQPRQTIDINETVIENSLAMAFNSAGKSKEPEEETK